MRRSCRGVAHAEEDDVADVTRLSPEIQQVIESIGLYFEQYGLPRIGGRLVGLLLFADRPLTLDAMAGALGVSRASVSTNIRVLAQLGIAEPVGLPGDRRDYYRFGEDAWERGLIVRMDAAERSRRIAERGLTGVAPDDDVARGRLAEMLAFCAFLLDEERTRLERWRALRRAMRERGAAGGSGVGT